MKPKTPKRKTLLQRKLAALRDTARAYKSRAEMFRILDAIEQAIPGVTVEQWAWSNEGSVMLNVDRFGDAAGALRTLHKVIGRKADSLPAVRHDAMSRTWHWDLPHGRLAFTAQLTGKVCRLEQIGEHVVHHPAHDEVVPIMKLVCPPEEVS